MSDIQKLLEKKKKDGKGLSDHEKEAKLGVLKHLHDMAADAMGEGLKGLKKVTVASDSHEGLKEGLETAKEVVGDSEESPLHEGAEEVEAEDAEHESPEGHHDLEMESDEEKSHPSLHEDVESELSEDELDAKLKELMAKKEALKLKKGY